MSNGVIFELCYYMHIMRAVSQLSASACLGRTSPVSTERRLMLCTACLPASRATLRLAAIERAPSQFCHTILRLRSAAYGTFLQVLADVILHKCFWRVRTAVYDSNIEQLKCGTEQVFKWNENQQYYLVLQHNKAQSAHYSCILCVLIFGILANAPPPSENSCIKPCVGLWSCLKNACWNARGHRSCWISSILVELCYIPLHEIPSVLWSLLVQFCGFLNIRHVRGHYCRLAVSGLCFEWCIHFLKGYPLHWGDILPIEKFVLIVLIL